MRQHTQQTRDAISSALKHKTRTELQKKNYSKAKQGEKSPTAKLRNENVLEIRKRLLENESYRDIAFEWEVTWQNIRAIHLRSTWKHLNPLPGELEMVETLRKHLEQKREEEEHSIQEAS